MTTDVEQYLADGCGRCPLGGTADCKVNTWREELILLRRIALDCGLTEEMKWGVPCYTFRKSNVAIVSAFREYSSLSFFKGVLLQDEQRILDKPGENSQSARVIKFTNTQDIIKSELVLKSYLFEAIEVEKAGLKVEFKESKSLVYSEELQNKMGEDPAFKAAFEALTPGRQRGYNLYFSAAKQSKTREARIEKSMPRIFEGRGLNEY